MCCQRKPGGQPCSWPADNKLLAGCLVLLQVFSSGKGYDINIDCHRAGAFLRPLLPPPPP